MQRNSLMVVAGRISGAGVPTLDADDPRTWAKAELDFLTERRDHALEQAASMRETERKARALAEQFEAIARMHEAGMTRLATAKG